MKQYLVLDKISWINSDFNDDLQSGFIEIHLTDKTSIRIDFDNRSTLESYIEPIIKALPPTIEISNNQNQEQI